MSEGKLRTSQIITTFGPGAMVDFPDASVIVGGLDTWKYDPEVPGIEEPRLVEKLRKLLNKPNITLRAPPPANERGHGAHPGITGWRFPEWFIVQHKKPVLAPRGFRKRRLVHLNALDRNQYVDHERTRNPVVPVRFVRACKKGHAGDIDWKAFVHQGPKSCAREMWMEERGTSGDLDEIWVTCDCGAERAMSQAARMDNERNPLGRCNGSRPWLGPGAKEGCGEPSRLLIRSASNAYFPQILSVISIPDTHGAVDGVVRSLWDDFLNDVESPADLAKARKKPTVAAKLQGIDDATVLASIARVRGGPSDDRPVKAVEFEALAEAKDELGSDTPDGDFYARALPREEWEVPWMADVERVVLVHRLREVVAQLGFTRFEAAGPDIEGELSLDVKRAPLAQDATWLPAIANRGEGVFLLFKEKAVSDWLKKPKVIARGLELDAGFKKWKDEHEGSSWNFPGLPYYLLHSFSHLLLTAMALECGYPASSLRERVYAGQGRYGILIYTGSTDAEGTLGGLVLAGRDIARHIRRALDMAGLCSNDPVCAHHSAAGHDHRPLHGAACHGCLLIAETSCEQRNDFLDRSLVVPTVEHLGCEFFTAP